MTIKISNSEKYTSCGYGCGLYSEQVFVHRKALKQTHSKLCNWFSNATIENNQPLENRSRGRTKYIHAA